MTRVTFFQNLDGQLVGFTCENHAGFAEEGGDIVCAGISALVMNTLNAIEAFTEDEFTADAIEADAYVSFRLAGTPSHDCQLLLKSLVLGLQGIEDGQYTDFIDILFEEV